jgi:FMN phosphatase YigB (HAD superfamily)
MDDLVFFFDVDNTLLDNDRVQHDLDVHLAERFGEAIRERYWAVFDDQWAKTGYADYLGTVERCRLEAVHDPRLINLASFLIDYPFAERLYPGALEAITFASRHGRVVALSDGDAVYQPRKVQRSGLWNAFDGRVLIFVHKELELETIEKLYPARRYVMIDDKLRILSAVKAAWGDRVATVFPRQGRYAVDQKALAAYPPADIAIAAIRDIVALDRAKFAP